MAEAWKELISKQLDIDRERHVNNPGIQNLSALLGQVMQSGMERKKAERTEAAGTRNIARTAAYSRYPGAAARDAGISVPDSGSTVPTMPEGMGIQQISVDESGQVSTQYGPDLSESSLAKMYNTYVTEVMKANQEIESRASMLPSMTAEPIPVPAFDQWKQDHFGISPTVGITSKGDDQLMQQLGITEEDVSYTIEQEGITREDLFAHLRSQLGG